MTKLKDCLKRNELTLVLLAIYFELKEIVNDFFFSFDSKTKRSRKSHEIERLTTIVCNDDKIKITNTQSLSLTRIHN